MSSNARGGTGPVQPEFLANTNNTLGIQFWVAQVLADKWGITREEMDAYALQSHQRAAANTDNGFFAGEIIPVEADLDDDEGIRRGRVAGEDRVAAARVGERRPARARHHRRQRVADDRRRGRDDHRVGRLRRANNLPVRARFKHFAVAAEDPVLVLSAPVPSRTS